MHFTLIGSILTTVILVLQSTNKDVLAQSTPSYTDNQVSALFDKGNALDRLGNYTRAIQYYDKALAIKPNDTATLYDKGLALNKLGNHTGAIKYYDKFLAIKPNNRSTLYNKGNALYQLGNYAGAIESYDKALAIDPKNVFTLYNKAFVLDRLGNHTGAIQYYDKVLGIQPTNVDALNNKANALGKLGKYVEATKYYQKAINIIKSNKSNQSSADTKSKDEIIKSVCESLGEDRLKLATYLSTSYKVQDTEQFFIKESLVQKVRAFGAFLAVAIPIAISIIQLISKGG